MARLAKVNIDKQYSNQERLAYLIPHYVQKFYEGDNYPTHLFSSRKEYDNYLEEKEIRGDAVSAAKLASYQPAGDQGYVRSPSIADLNRQLKRRSGVAPAVTYNHVITSAVENGEPMSDEDVQGLAHIYQNALRNSNECGAPEGPSRTKESHTLVTSSNHEDPPELVTSSTYEESNAPGGLKISMTYEESNAPGPSVNLKKRAISRSALHVQESDVKRTRLNSENPDAEAPLSESSKTAPLSHSKHVQVPNFSFKDAQKESKWLQRWYDSTFSNEDAITERATNITWLARYLYHAIRNMTSIIDQPGSLSYQRLKRGLQNKEFGKDLAGRVGNQLFMFYKLPLEQRTGDHLTFKQRLDYIKGALEWDKELCLSLLDPEKDRKARLSLFENAKAVFDRTLLKKQRLESDVQIPKVTIPCEIRETPNGQGVAIEIYDLTGASPLNEQDKIVEIHDLTTPPRSRSTQGNQTYQTSQNNLRQTNVGGQQLFTPSPMMNVVRYHSPSQQFANLAPPQQLHQQKQAGLFAHTPGTGQLQQQAGSFLPTPHTQLHNIRPSLESLGPSHDGQWMKTVPGGQPPRVPFAPPRQPMQSYGDPQTETRQSLWAPGWDHNAALLTQPVLNTEYDTSYHRQLVAQGMGYDQFVQQQFQQTVDSWMNPNGLQNVQHRQQFPGNQQQFNTNLYPLVPPQQPGGQKRGHEEN
ncbi:hypothetical protein M501DRAFT_1016922 [Patellaria atrata CBS 101060]|uniref:Uncharacterized protein n=1 Tax=Patellaria atrata CBS 101060 TaxID=1346257 RepID=A0A9P4SBJ9_9PEZI|nr:hypothetical protein M501DRAFT_1016922 [Patellaria atrata CBS 101060]